MIPQFWGKVKTELLRWRLNLVEPVNSAVVASLALAVLQFSTGLLSFARPESPGSVVPK